MFDAVEYVRLLCDECDCEGEYRNEYDGATMAVDDRVMTKPYDGCDVERMVMKPYDSW